MTNDEMLHKWVEGTISEDELTEFKSRPEYPTLVELYKNTEGLSAPHFDEDAMLSDILRQPKNKLRAEKKDRRIFLKKWVTYAAAASVALLVGYFLWPYGSSDLTEYKMASGESMEAFLPDESLFYLNAGSEISYNEKKWKNDRTLFLEGEAFFEVKKGSTFTVKTPNGSVQVLGTKFNVWSRQETLEVKCESGRVAIFTTGGKKLEELNANDAFQTMGSGKNKKWEINSNEIASWREGISKFNDVPLSVVLSELERQFDIKIKTEKINTKEIISCNFQHENLELALKTTLSPLNIKWVISGNKVELSQ